MIMIFVYAEIGKTGAFSKFMISPFGRCTLTEKEYVNTYFTHIECNLLSTAWVHLRMSVGLP